MVVSLVDALVALDLAQLGVVGDMVVPLPCRRRFVSPSTKRMGQRHRHSPVPIPLSPKKNMRKDVRRASSHVFEKRVHRHFYISGSFEIKNLEGEGPPEPVRLGTTEMVADVGSGFIPFIWEQACP